MLELRLDPISFLGDHDEANFFRWLKAIPGYQSFKGEGAEMRAYFSREDLTPLAFLELIRFSLRYQIDRERLLPLLDALPDSTRQEYLTPGSRWHDALFGAQPRNHPRGR